MVKWTIWSEHYNNEITKFTRELDRYGMEEELLFPILLNKRTNKKLTLNLATYLVKYKEFEKTSVEIQNNSGKDGFCRLNSHVGRCS